MNDVMALCWPRARLGELAGRTAVLVGACEVAPVLPGPPLRLAGDEASGAPLRRWVDAALRRARLQGQTPDARATSVDALLPSGPAALWVGLRASGAAAGPPDRFLLLRRSAATFEALAPDGRLVALERDVVDAAVFGGEDGSADAVAALGLTGARVAHARQALRRHGNASSPTPEAWVVSPALPGFWQRFIAAGGRRHAIVALLGALVQVAVFGTAWSLLGSAALEGRLEHGWLMAFALLLATALGVRAVSAWALGRLAIVLSGLLRERLLEGILRLPADAIRSQGVGQLLGRVIETEAVEAMARGGGVQVVQSLVELGLGAVALGYGAGGGLQVAALVVWLGLVAVVLRRYHRRLVNFTSGRLHLTHDLVERMVGHRTLVVQDPAGHHARHDDEALGHHADRGAALDRDLALLPSVVPRGWLVLGLTALAPAFAHGGADPAGLALALGGVLLVHGALRRFAEGAPTVVTGLVAWENMRALLDAATPEVERDADLLLAAAADDDAGSHALLTARDLVYRHASRPEPVLRGASFTILRGERVLLEGGSGAGKSTLGAILSGLRAPQSGVLLLGGFDHHSVGPERWRQRAGAVPQFHENHVISASLLFNLLMGRRWPPRYEDLLAAQKVCADLGLDDVIARMPSGILQLVGDTGWQLSHGERSRVFLARSLLQGVDVRILDESFAALDPVTFSLALDASLRRSDTLIVIAHA